jgi:hypothetical protein
MTRVAIRLYLAGQLAEEIVVDAETADASKLAAEHAEKAHASEKQPHMIELEWLDDPNPLTRFTRFGTDPSRMVLPIKYKVEKP